MRPFALPSIRATLQAEDAHGKTADQATYLASKLRESASANQASANKLLLTDFRNTGNQGSRTKTAKITTRRKSSEWSAFGKTCCAATAACSNRSLELAKGFEPPTP
jgi:hypothetical protein